MKKFILVSLAFIVYALIATAQPVMADGDTICRPVYGAVYGGSNCPPAGNVTIDKKVQNPKSGQYVDNMTVNDPRYTAGQTVNFQLTVSNTGTGTIDKVEVKDIFPSHVSFAGGAGTYNEATKTLSLDVQGVKAGDARTLTVSGKIASADTLPTDQQVTCVVNQAQAVANGQTMTDAAQLCIESVLKTKGGLPVAPAPKVSTTPATGPEMALMFGMIPMGSLGYFLRRKAKK